LAEYLLRGDVTEGVGFPDERAVEFTDLDGRPVTTIVPEQFVIRRNGDNYLRVKLIGSERGVSVIYVPGEVFGATRMVSVADAQVITA